MIHLAIRGHDLSGEYTPKQLTQAVGAKKIKNVPARALAAQPRLLVMDEPESNLDFRNQLVILDIIRHLAHEHGMSVIVNTHFPAHALKLSDKALLLGRGETDLYGAARDVITEDNMRRAFGVNVSIHDFQRGGVTYNTVVPLSIAAQG